MMNRLGLVSWRLPGDIFNTIYICKKYDINFLQLDYGGHARGPFINSYCAKDMKLIALQNNVKFSAIALNVFNDIGVNINPSYCKKIFIDALSLTEKLEVSTIFIPAFRQSSINNELDLINTAGFFRWCCDVADSNITVASENILTPDKCKMLCLLVGRHNFKVIYDPANLFCNSVDPFEYLVEMMPNIHSDIHIKSPNGNSLLSLEKNFISLIDYISLMPESIISNINFFLENDYRINMKGDIESDISWIKKHSPFRGYGYEKTF